MLPKMSPFLFNLNFAACSFACSFACMVYIELVKNYPGRNSPGLLNLLWQVLFRGSDLLQIL